LSFSKVAAGQGYLPAEREDSSGSDYFSNFEASGCLHDVIAFLYTRSRRFHSSANPRRKSGAWMPPVFLRFPEQEARTQSQGTRTQSPGIGEGQAHARLIPHTFPSGGFVGPHLQGSDLGSQSLRGPPRCLDRTFSCCRLLRRGERFEIVPRRPHRDGSLRGQTASRSITLRDCAGLPVVDSGLEPRRQTA